MPDWLKSVRIWFLISLINFFIAAVTGIIMRYAFVDENVVLPYRNILQAHSHLAILGWVFLANFCLLFYNAQKNLVLQTKQSIALLIAEISVCGMFISFLFSGYNGLTIFFLTTHMISAFWLIIQYIQLETLLNSSNPYRKLWIGAALFFLVLSFLSPLALGYISASDGKGSAIYYAAVQFFLHFQFNGWLLFVLLGLIWGIIEEYEIELNKKHMLWGFRLLFISCFLTFALAVAWSTPHPLIYLANSLGVILQLAAAVLLSVAFYQVRKQLKEKLDKSLYGILMVVMALFLIKIIIQTAVVLPDFAVIAYTIRNYILAFIHLMLLGVISAGIVAIAHHYKIITLNNALGKQALLVFTMGFVITELFLFLQGTMQWASLGFMKYFHEIMFAGSILLATGIALLLLAQRNLKQNLLLLNKKQIKK